MLKAFRPEKYRDRSNLKVEWDGDPKNLTDAQLEKLERVAREEFEAEEARKKVMEASGLQAPASQKTIRRGSGEAVIWGGFRMSQASTLTLIEKAKKPRAICR
jgi:hypothetical protein